MTPVFQFQNVVKRFGSQNVLDGLTLHGEPDAIRKAASQTGKYSLASKYSSKPLYFLIPPF